MSKTLEASAMDGRAQGAEAVRSIVVAAKGLYEYDELTTLLCDA